MSRRRDYRLSYRRSDGVRRYTKLYRMWKNIRNRVKGKSTRTPHLYEGLEVGFKTFDEFRRFALRNGFGKGMSPDRIDPSRGYTKDNLRFVPLKQNCARLGDDDLRGPEPEHYEYEEVA